MLSDPSWAFLEYVLGSVEQLPAAALERFAAERQQEFEGWVQEVSAELDRAGKKGVGGPA
ncbi:hypothetical protein U7230_07375 [Carboxydochorda subterranea]|uniref:Uncharacterized protein n=1 Tax=Carboxydichorda subterranea TaxID=3109565 RepID=A0ABZ1C126_9FIRM|nr:hypothetical protein [Limnochorda sp. L945t]WRP18804.1 hypothetical protein U7230_07375 [Limnochorda sp. L945t]